MTGADRAFPEVYDKVRPELSICHEREDLKTK